MQLHEAFEAPTGRLGPRLSRGWFAGGALARACPQGRAIPRRYLPSGPKVLPNLFDARCRNGHSLVSALQNLQRQSAL